MTIPKDKTDHSEEEYIDKVYEAALTMSTHKEEVGNYIAIDATTLVSLIESHRQLTEIRKSN
jgi:hypothetical protein